MRRETAETLGHTGATEAVAALEVTLTISERSFMIGSRCDMPRPRQFDRQQVLLKAMMTFRDKGYAATSVQDLVERTGINRFSLYETFKSKHDLFVEALQAYHEGVAIPFFSRLEDSKEGLRVIESILIGLVSQIKSGRSPNGCLLCNTMAEVGARRDEPTTTILKRYLKTVEDGFHAAIVRAKELGEIPGGANAREHAKALVAYSTGLLSLAKVLSEREMRESVRATIGALK